MDIYDFINSKSVSDYCRKIGHKFTPVQAAFLVNRSVMHTLKEKREAFRFIMEHMPDEETNSCVRHMDDGQTCKAGIHWLLNRYMELQSKYLKEFFKHADHQVYEYRVYRSWNDYWEGEYCHSVDSVFSYIEQEISSDEQVVQIRVGKSRMDGSSQSILVSFNGKREVTDIDMEGAWEMSEEEQDIVYGMDGVCFVCPVPFKKGDIVYAPFYEGMYSPGADIFVFDHVWYEGLEEEDVVKCSSSRHCCSADMVACGQFQHEDGGLYYECMHDYLGLEYYTGPLDGKKRILKAVSNYLKGEIDLTLVLNAYYLIMCEENAKGNKRRMNITREGLRLAGLLEG